MSVITYDSSEYSKWKENKECCNYKPGKFLYEEGRAILSFDTDNRNFHFVPEGEAAEQENSVLKDTKKKLKKSSINLLGGGKGNSLYTKRHYYYYWKDEYSNFEYLIGHSRLWIDETQMTINNSFGGYQFMRYRDIYIKANGKKLDNINFDKEGNFKMMYPVSSEDGYFRYDINTGHCVYNPYLPDYEPETIASVFEAFVRVFTIDGKVSSYGTIDGRIDNDRI